MPRIILLDIDDVLSADRSIAACREFDEESVPGYRVPIVGDRVALGLINRACRTCSAKVVVSSTWLAIAGPDYTLNWLTSNGLDAGHLLASDPCVNYHPSRCDKLEAINDWRVQSPATPPDHIVVIDDNPDLFPTGHPLAERQVIVDGEDGLLLRHYREIIAKLGGTDRDAGVFGPLRFGPVDE